MEIRREIFGSSYGNIKKSWERLLNSNPSGPSRPGLRQPISMILKTTILQIRPSYHLHSITSFLQLFALLYWPKVHSSIIYTKLFPMSEISQLVLSPELQELQSKLKEATSEMEQHAKEGKYVLAESCRVNAEKLKKELEGKKVVEVQRRQKKENREVKKYLKDELLEFNKEWDAKFNHYSVQTAKWVVELKEKQAKEREEARERLEEEIPEKCKDSSECLNLRKIQAGLAKQHNYVQALKVQKQVKEMEKKEQQAWLKLKNEKVELGLQQLKQRQQVQAKALDKRIESGRCELQLEKEKAEAKLVHKHANVSKDIQSQNRKEFLATKGEFKTRVDVLSPTRSRLLSPTSRSKLFTSTR